LALAKEWLCSAVGKVTAGLAESYGNCILTTQDRYQIRNQTLLSSIFITYEY